MNRNNLIFFLLVIGMLGPQLANCKPKSTLATTVSSVTTTELEEETEEFSSEAETSTKKLKPDDEDSSSSSSEADDDDEENNEDLSTLSTESSNSTATPDTAEKEENDEDETSKDLSLKSIKKLIHKFRKNLKKQEKNFELKIDAIVKDNRNQSKNIEELNSRVAALERNENPVKPVKKQNELYCIKKKDAKNPKNVIYYESVRYKNSYAQFNNTSNPRECWKKCYSDSKCIASSFDSSKDFFQFKSMTTDEEEDVKEEKMANCFLYDCDIGFDSYKLGWKSYSLISTGDILKLDFERKLDLN